jgi:hypothetical protein
VGCHPVTLREYRKRLGLPPPIRNDIGWDLWPADTVNAYVQLIWDAGRTVRLDSCMPLKDRLMGYLLAAGSATKGELYVRFRSKEKACALGAALAELLAEGLVSVSLERRSASGIWKEVYSARRGDKKEDL